MNQNFHEFILKGLQKLTILLAIKLFFRYVNNVNPFHVSTPTPNIVSYHVFLKYSLFTKVNLEEKNRSFSCT